jgi:tungstate transport system substrate-binding protein
VLVVLANTLLGLPPVVVGLAVYLLLSRSGPLLWRTYGDSLMMSGASRLRAIRPLMRMGREEKKELGQQFIDWLVSLEGQKAIADYEINGEQLFYPNANDPTA